MTVSLRRGTKPECTSSPWFNRSMGLPCLRDWMLFEPNTGSYTRSLWRSLPQHPCWMPGKLDDCMLLNRTPGNYQMPLVFKLQETVEFNSILKQHPTRDIASHFTQ
jgi:hypothetical protein